MTDVPSFDDDDLPWASPDVQMNYEAALGRFILGYNSIDNLLTELIETVLKKLRRDEKLIKQCQGQGFWHKLLIFDILKSSHAGGGILHISLDPIKEINIHRNRLAHGHYDCNDNAFFDGNYYLINNQKMIKHIYSVQDLNDLIQKADDVFSDLRYAETFYDFSDDEDTPANS